MKSKEKTKSGAQPTTDPTPEIVDHFTKEFWPDLNWDSLINNFRSMPETDPYADLQRFDDLYRIRIDDNHYPDFWMEISLNSDFSLDTVNGRHIHPNQFLPENITLDCSDSTNLKIRDALHPSFHLGLEIENNAVRVLQLIH